MQYRNRANIRNRLLCENDLLFLSRVERFVGLSIISLDRGAFATALVASVRALAATGLAGPVLRPPVFFDAFVNAIRGMSVAAAAHKAVERAPFIAQRPGTPRTLHAESWAWARARLEAASEEDLEAFALSRARPALASGSVTGQASQHDTAIAPAAKAA